MYDAGWQGLDGASFSGWHGLSCTVPRSSLFTELNVCIGSSMKKTTHGNMFSVEITPNLEP